MYLFIFFNFNFRKKKDKKNKKKIDEVMTAEAPQVKKIDAQLTKAELAFLKMQEKVVS